LATKEELLEISRDNYRNAWAGLRMIRDAIGKLGPPGVLASEERVVRLYGPEPVHEAQAIVDALKRWRDQNHSGPKPAD
jgi:hypothetical protein